jgi:hypothetical protein
VIWWQHVLALAGGLALIGFLVFNYRRLPAIWRGDQAPTLRNPLFTVYPRSYVSYMCFLTAFVGGFALLLIVRRRIMGTRAVQRLAVGHARRRADPRRAFGSSTR